MVFHVPLVAGGGQFIEAHFVARRTPLLIEARLQNQPIRAHLPDANRIEHYLASDARIVLTPRNEIGRKTAFQVLGVYLNNDLCVVDDGLPQRLVAAALSADAFPQFARYTRIQPHFRLGEQRFDFRLGEGLTSCVLQCAAVDQLIDGIGRFPDRPAFALTAQLDLLTSFARNGQRAAVLFLVHRRGARAFVPNDDIDPAFAVALRRAIAGGVEVYANRCPISISGATLGPALPVFGALDALPADAIIEDGETGSLISEAQHGGCVPFVVQMPSVTSKRNCPPYVSRCTAAYRGASEAVQRRLQFHTWECMAPSSESGPLRRTAGLTAALICAGILFTIFAFVSSATPMPPAERWAALTTFALLTLAYTLQGSPGLYDALGQAVRRDWRAYAVLVALLPALYLAYSSAVGEFTLAGLGSAVLLAAVPGVAFYAGRGQRRPVILDWVGHPVPLAQPGARPDSRTHFAAAGWLVGFFPFALAPLVLLTLAARGWTGLGFTWFLRGRDLRDALVVGIPLALLGVLLSPNGGPSLQPAALTILAQAVQTYFFVALPAELL
ncbi:DNA/RNA nuclease SfsA [Candidatus Gracilibacteria bacterium]|nr:DNA/RNA nuclease SfsA [Candidatus Gracilibacteria bacterium]